MPSRNAKVSVAALASMPTLLGQLNFPINVCVCVSSSFGGSRKPGATSDLQIPWSMRLVIEAPGQIV